MNDQKLKIIYTTLDNLESTPFLSNMLRCSVIESKPIVININIKGKVLNYQVSVRSELRANQLHLLGDNTGAVEQIIIAEKITKEAKELLVANEQAYIESSGNIYLPQKDMMILLDVRGAGKISSSGNSRAFTKTGLKVLFHFLVNQAFLSMPYRQIAKETGTSLGNVTNIINALIRHGYLAKTDDKNLYLKNKEELFKTWMDRYEHILKPSLEMGRFRFRTDEDFQNWRRTRLEDKITVWGGQPGAHLLMGRPSPNILTIYTEEPRADLMTNYRLEKDPDGNVYVYRKFWSYSDLKINVAPTLLLYTDLINSNLEKDKLAAEKLFDDVLRGKLNLKE